ncbi:MAG: aldehyde dehydrogenase family protein [Pigmentiphaga sp.]
MSTADSSLPLCSYVNGQSLAVGSAVSCWEAAGRPGLTLRIDEADERLVDQAVQGATRAFARYRQASLAERMAVLGKLAAALDAEAPALADLISQDVGKPIRVARGEVARGASFVRACVAEIAQQGGEVIPVDAVQAGAGRFGFTKRHPYGVVGAITPFNAPINLLVQKVAPALAAGNACVVKPAPAGIRTALHLAQAAVEQGLEPGLFNVLTGGKDAAIALASHTGVGVVSFTGGVEAGESLARCTGVRRFVSELGSNAANVVLADADLDEAARKIAAASFEASGQQCISAQRVIVEAAVYDDFVERFVQYARALRVGPADQEDVDVGPVVSRASADRIMGLVDDALSTGAQALLAPKREGLLISPVILGGLTPSARLWHEEVFGPVAVLIKADSPAQALDIANDSPFGLQAAVFTSSLKQAFTFSERLEVGALWVNEASRFRLDMYPFGGMKLSGVGREGVRYAIEELSQVKFTGIHWR